MAAVDVDNSRAHREAAMAARSSVVVYGSSMFLAGIGEQLRQSGKLNVRRIEPDGAAAGARLRRLNPAVVLIDLASAQPDAAIALLRHQPELVVMAVDPSSDKVLVLSGRQEQAVSASDLVQAVLDVSCRPDIRVRRSQASGKDTRCSGVGSA